MIKDGFLGFLEFEWSFGSYLVVGKIGVRIRQGNEREGGWTKWKYWYEFLQMDSFPIQNNALTRFIFFRVKNFLYLCLTMPRNKRSPLVVLESVK